MGGKGVEPLRTFAHTVLSRTPLPFRHSPICKYYRNLQEYCKAVCMVANCGARLINDTPRGCACVDQQFAKIFQFRTDFRSRTCRAARGPADVRHAQLTARNCLILTNQGTDYFPRCLSARHLPTTQQLARRCDFMHKI